MHQVHALSNKFSVQRGNLVISEYVRTALFWSSANFCPTFRDNICL